MENIALLLIVIPALPLAAAIVTALIGPLSHRMHPLVSAVPVVAGIILSCVCSLMLLGDVIVQQRDLALGAPNDGFERVVTLWNWAAVAKDESPAAAQADAASGNLAAGSLASGPDHDFVIDITLRADALTAMMLAMVTFVSSLVAIYSVGYMSGDRGFWRFFSFIGLFVFSMTMLVSASNFVLLFVFWEAVGLCSYLLIGFWYEKPSAAAAGKKAFLVNRVGDFAFLLGLFVIWTNYGTLNFHTPGAKNHVQVSLTEQSEEPARSPADVVPGILSQERISSPDGYVNYKRGASGTWIALAIPLLLMMGACGKSAQFPLHIWLPDAMEGPTPVSALIHAATMVTAGVYMVARCTPLFMASPEALLVVAAIGAFTALLAALIALTQYDLKRVLAYSTISQLGYMFLGLGTGTLVGITSGMFHLFTHAFFKALLFLGAGSVMHAMGNVIDMRQFGGLRRRMPITHWTFLCGCLALAGVPPFSGFWSKDSIIGAVHDKVHELSAHEAVAHVAAGGGAAAGESAAVAPTPLTLIAPEAAATIYDVLYYASVVTALLTAFYTFRAYFMTFHGEERIPSEAGDHAHESPMTMWLPLAILAFFAVVVGIYFDQTWRGAGHAFETFLTGAPSLAAGAVAVTAAPGEFHYEVAAISTVLAVAGVGAAAYFYLGESQQIDRVTSLMNFEWLIRLTDPQTVSSLDRVRWIAFVRRTARSVGLGWLVSLIGYAILVVLLILAAPLLIGYYISPFRLSRDKFYFDEIYTWLVVGPLRFAATVSFWIDRWIVDGLVNFFGRVPPWIGSLMRSLQMGLVQFYALAMVLGVLILVTARLLFA